MSSASRVIREIVAHMESNEQAEKQYADYCLSSTLRYQDASDALMRARIWRDAIRIVEEHGES